MKLKIDFDKELKTLKEFKVQKLNLFKNQFTIQELDKEYTTQEHQNKVVKNSFIDKNNKIIQLSFKTTIPLNKGDAIAINPKNNTIFTTNIMHKLNYKNMYIKELKKSTFDVLLQLDFTISKKSQFRWLAEYSNGQDKQRLLFISSKDGKNLFNLLTMQYPTLLDLLDLFPSLEIPLDILISNLQQLKPRFT